MFPHLFAIKWWDRLPWSSLFERWVLSQRFHSPLSLSSRGSLFSLSAIRLVSSPYLRLLIFLPVNLIPACASSSPVFLMMYSAYKLNKQGDPITSWQIDGETMETVTDFIFLGSKITAYGDCSHEMKRCLLLGRNVVTNLDNILKSRDIILLTNVHLVKAMVFQYSCMDVRTGPERKLRAKQLMLLNCVWENS